MLRKEIDQLLQFPVSLLQSRLRSVALDGDSSNPAGVIDQLDFGRLRMANFAIIHGKRPQHLAIVCHDGARPGAAQATLQGNVSVAGPLGVR